MNLTIIDTSALRHCLCFHMWFSCHVFPARFHKIWENKSATQCKCIAAVITPRNLNGFVMQMEMNAVYFNQLILFFEISN